MDMILARILCELKSAQPKMPMNFIDFHMTNFNVAKIKGCFKK